ncbi:unnamed protein product [Alopecurus aequalis]
MAGPVTEAAISTAPLFPGFGPLQLDASMSELQLGAVTSQVGQLALSPPPTPALADGDDGVAQFFTPAAPPLLQSPAPTPVAPRPTTPLRRSPRQAMIGNTVPVSQRASLRIVQQLGILGPNEAMTKEAAAAAVGRFKVPLTQDDIDGIAKLTNLDSDALRVAAGLDGPDGVAIIA